MTRNETIFVKIQSRTYFTKKKVTLNYSQILNTYNHIFMFS